MLKNRKNKYKCMFGNIAERVLKNIYILIENLLK